MPGSRPTRLRKPPIAPDVAARLRNLVLNVLTLAAFLLVIAGCCAIGYICYRTATGLSNLGE